MLVIVWILFFLSLWASCQAVGEQSVLDLRIPARIPVDEGDHHMCTVMELGDHTLYINAFEADMEQDRVSHVNVYACRTPYITPEKDKEPVWPCFSGMSASQVCAGDEEPSLLFFQANGENGLRLEPGVGFPVAGDTGLDFLVMSAHYRSLTGIGAPVNLPTQGSGVRMSLIPSHDVTGKAGSITLLTTGVAKRHAITHADNACLVNESVTIRPLIFKVHTHGLGTMVSGWKIDGVTGEWTLIGRRDPRKDQSYQLVKEEMSIREGDWIASRCTYNNTSDQDVELGSSGEGEMCVFLLIYAVDPKSPIMDMRRCRSPGFPSYSWSTDPLLPLVSPAVDLMASLSGLEE